MASQAMAITQQLVAASGVRCSSATAFSGSGSRVQPRTAIPKLGSSFCGKAVVSSDALGVSRLGLGKLGLVDRRQTTREAGFQVRAATVDPEGVIPPAGHGADGIAVPAAVDPVASQWTKTLQLGSLFGLWYLFNIYFNIYNKQVQTHPRLRPHSLQFRAVPGSVCAVSPPFLRGPLRGLVSSLRCEEAFPFLGNSLTRLTLESNDFRWGPNLWLGAVPACQDVFARP